MVKINSQDTLFKDLDSAQAAMLAEAPRQNRLPLLAQFRRETELETTRQLARNTGLPLLEEFELRRGATDLLPLRLIHEYQCVPFTLPSSSPETIEAPAGVAGSSPASPSPTPDDRLDLATLWPPEETMDEWIYAVCGRKPRWFISPAKQVVNCITQNFGVGADSLSESDVATEDSGREAEESEDENAALIRFVNEVIGKAIEDRATDIHFEPLRESLQIRYRIDGELVPIRVPDNLIRYQSAIISRLKIMAKLNISEKRRPQDGRINWRGGANELDIRISTMPTMYGESISLRLLNQKNQPLSMEELGMLPGDRKRIESVLDLPHGIILVTGPTGSGKSTSLTAFIRQINSPGRRIITVEDPVEYEVEGVNQTQVHSEIGYTFASALRHILRQDPDVIMVGEIRDRETADIAVRASLTGHLVLSTLHTNDAPGAITRLIDMEIEPFLIASAVELVIAQRLVRRLCQECLYEVTTDPIQLRGSLMALLNEDPSPEDLAAKLYASHGCENCRNLGFRGRVGLFEILRVDETLHELIVRKCSAPEIREVAIRHGMPTLQRSGWNQVRRARTTLKEVMRFAHVGQEDEL